MSLALQLEQAELAGAGRDARRLRPLDYPRRRPLLERGQLRRRRSWGDEDVEVLVSAGDYVRPGDVVARFQHAGRAAAVNVPVALGLPPARATASLQRAVGDRVAVGEVLAERRVLGGLQRRRLRSPATGTLTYVSAEHGTAFVQPMPAELQILAHLGGTVLEVGPHDMVIEGTALTVAGLVGAGAAASGVLMVADTSDALPRDVSGAVVACPFPIDESIVRALTDGGAVALVAAGVEEATLERLGWDEFLWPRGASRTHVERRGVRPALPLTIVLLAPGPAAPPPGVWEVLQPLAGRPCSALGAEPGLPTELLVSLGNEMRDPAYAGPEAAPVVPMLAPGTRARAIAGRAEGLSGKIVDLSVVPFRLGSEVQTDVANVAFPYDVHLRLPLIHLQPLP